MSVPFENSASASTLFISSSSLKISESVDRVAPNTASPLLSPPAEHNAAFGGQAHDIAVPDVGFGLLGGLVASPSIYENLSGMADDDAALSSDFSSFTSGLVPSPSIYERLSSLGDDDSSTSGVDVFVSGLVPSPSPCFVSSLVASPSTYENLSSLGDDASCTFGVDVFVSGLVSSPSVYADLSSLGDDEVVLSSHLSSTSFVSGLVSSPTYENLSSNSLGGDVTSSSTCVLVSSPTYNNISMLCNTDDTADNSTAGRVSTNEAPSPAVPTSKLESSSKAKSKAGLYGGGRRVPTARSTNDSESQEPSRSCSSTSDKPDDTVPARAFAPVPREKRVRTRIASTRQHQRSASTTLEAGRGRQSSALRISVLVKNAFRVKAEEKMRSMSVAQQAKRPGEERRWVGSGCQ